MSWIQSHSLSANSKFITPKVHEIEVQEHTIVATTWRGLMDLLGMNDTDGPFQGARMVSCGMFLPWKPQALVVWILGIFPFRKESQFHQDGTPMNGQISSCRRHLSRFRQIHRLGSKGWAKLTKGDPFGTEKRGNKKRTKRWPFWTAQKGWQFPWRCCYGMMSALTFYVFLYVETMITQRSADITKV